MDFKCCIKITSQHHLWQFVIATFFDRPTWLVVRNPIYSRLIHFDPIYNPIRSLLDNYRDLKHEHFQIDRTSIFNIYLMPNLNHSFYYRDVKPKNFTSTKKDKIIHFVDFCALPKNTLTQINTFLTGSTTVWPARFLCSLYGMCLLVLWWMYSLARPKTTMWMILSFFDAVCFAA